MENTKNGECEQREKGRKKNNENQSLKLNNRTNMFVSEAAEKNYIDNNSKRVDPGQSRMPINFN